MSSCHHTWCRGAVCVLSSLCCYHDNMTLICSDQLVPDIGEHCTAQYSALRLHNWESRHPALRHPVCVTRHHPVLIRTSLALYSLQPPFTQSWHDLILLNGSFSKLRPLIFEVLSNFTTDVKYTHKTNVGHYTISMLYSKVQLSRYSSRHCQVTLDCLLLSWLNNWVPTEESSSCCWSLIK